MAMLALQAIFGDRAERHAKAAQFGLMSVYRYLEQSKRHAKDPDNQNKVAWEACDDQAKAGPVWVRLKDRKTGRDLSDALIRDFTGEAVEMVFSIKEQPRWGEASQMTISVLDRDPDEGRLKLKEVPHGQLLCLMPNTYQLDMQIKAIRDLQNDPHRDHAGLLRLLSSRPDWPDVPRREEPDWMSLTERDRAGAAEQREFVGKALATPDFAFLDGPPGSGKTTVICELALQMARAGKRVLLCASTHVAVDNVLERLMDDASPHRDLINPVRIGRESRISDMAARWTFENRAKEELKRLRRFHAGVTDPSPGQKMLRDLLSRSNALSYVERLLLDSANLVCGTTLGILQHPDIRDVRKTGHPTSPIFDMLIVDEASKTTFQEFLVPALWAKRWILVGDPRQLSPYVDDGELAANINATQPDAALREACVDVFLAAQGRHGAAAVATTPERTDAYRRQANAMGVTVREIGDEEAPLADIVLGSAAELEAAPNAVRIDLATLRAAEDEAPTLRRQLLARGIDEMPNWGGELAWRYSTLYALRRAHVHRDEDKLKREIAALQPVDADRTLSAALDSIRRIALPSVLECLQFGFERAPQQNSGNALSDGLPPSAFAPRHVLLSHQHRMHPDIAAFPARAFYDGKALHSDRTLADRPPWAYRADAPRVSWRQVSTGFERGANRNRKEVAEALHELHAFSLWAKDNPAKTGDWAVTVLTFYRGQERALREAIRNEAQTAGSGGQIRFGRNCVVTVCTVDRFQGQEADFVILSFVNDHATRFLKSPNRLNVALTRARHRLVLVGNREAFLKADGAMGELASDIPWGQDIDGGSR